MRFIIPFTVTSIGFMSIKSIVFVCIARMSPSRIGFPQTEFRFIFEMSWPERFGTDGVLIVPLFVLVSVFS